MSHIDLIKRTGTEQLWPVAVPAFNLNLRGEAAPVVLARFRVRSFLVISEPEHNARGETD